MPRGRIRISHSPESPRRKPARGRSPRNKKDRSSSSDSSRSGSPRRPIAGRRRSPVNRRKSPIRRRRSSSPIRSRRRSSSTRSSSSSSRAKSSSRSSSSSLSRSRSSSRSGSSSASYSSSSASVSPRKNRVVKSPKQVKHLVKRKSPSPPAKKSPTLSKPSVSVSTSKPKLTAEIIKINDKDKLEVKKTEATSSSHSRIDHPAYSEVEKKSTQKQTLSPAHKSKIVEKKQISKKNRSLTPEYKSKDRNVKHEVADTIKVDKLEINSKPYKQQSNAIRVANISRNVRNGHLQEIFSAYGKVKNINLPMVENLNIPKGYAKVEFEKPEDALTAQEHMDGAQIDGNNITVDMVALANKDLVESNKTVSKRQERSRSPARQKESSPVNRRTSQGRRRRSSSSSSSSASYHRRR